MTSRTWSESLSANFRSRRVRMPRACPWSGGRRAVLGDGEARHVVLVHQLLGVADGVVRPERDRVGDDAVGGALDLGDLAGLGLDGEVLVDDAHAALLGQRDRQGGLRHGVHGCGQQRDVQPDARVSWRGGVGVAGHHADRRGMSRTSSKVTPSLTIFLGPDCASAAPSHAGPHPVWWECSGVPRSWG
jgi:hypothetical protein